MSSSFNLPFIKLLPFIDYLVTFIDVFINSVKNIFTVTFFYLKKLFLYLQILGIPNLYPQFKLGTITFLYGYHKHFFFFCPFLGRWRFMLDQFWFVIREKLQSILAEGRQWDGGSTGLDRALT